MQISQSHRNAAAWAAIAYIAIQSFQWYAFSVMPEKSHPKPR